MVAGRASSDLALPARAGDAAPSSVTAVPPAAVRPRLSRPRSLRHVLGALTLASTLSMLALGGVSIALLARAEQDRFEAQLEVTARSLALGVDRRLGAAIAVVETLAASPSLGTGDLGAFEQQARAAAREGELVGLVDTEMRQRLNTMLPVGSAVLSRQVNIVRTGNEDHVRQTLSASGTLVSNVFLGARTRQHMVMASRRVDVMGAPHALTLGVPARELGAILREAQMGEGWVAAVLDRDLITTARTRAEDTIVGQPATAPVRALLGRQDSGLLRQIRTADGMLSTLAAARAPATGFSVAIAAPAPTILSGIGRVYGPFLALGLALTGVATALSVMVARRLLSAVDALAAPSPPSGSTGVREIDEAAERLRRTESARALLAGELSHRLKNVFAVATGLITAAARHAPEHRAFASALRERFLALAQATQWYALRPGQAATGGLRGLLRVVLAPYDGLDGASGGEPAITIEGDDVSLGPAASQALALATHELATNALKHGALGHGGRVRVRLTVRDDRLRFEWEETGGPAVSSPPSRLGFGTTLADATLARQLNGTLDREWRAEGLRVTASLPLTSLST